jgi:3-deoxy-D-manno-octulosonic-acid transferase
VRPSGPLVAKTVGQALLAPWLVGKAVRRSLRPTARHRDDLSVERFTGTVRAAGGGPVRRARGPVVAFVGMGFGELRMVERLDAALRARRPDVDTVWAVHFREARDEVARRRPGQATTRLPYDVVLATAGWLARVAPDVVVPVARYWFPALVFGARSAGARLVAANVAAWPHVPRGPLARPLAWERRRLLGCFDAIGYTSQDARDADAPWLGEPVRAFVAGDLKLDLEPPPPDPVRDGALARWIAPRNGTPLLAAGSTRGGDEAFVLDAFRLVRARRPCVLLLAPRQLDRVPAVVAESEARGFVVSRRTSPRPRADVFVLDTVGELAAAYGHASAAFVGGTLRHLGQNFVEPLSQGVPVAYGPAKTLLEDAQRACERAGLGARVETPEGLAAHWVATLERGVPRAALRARVDDFLAAHRGALGKTVDEIVAALARGPGEAGGRAATARLPA